MTDRSAVEIEQRITSLWWAAREQIRKDQTAKALGSLDEIQALEVQLKLRLGAKLWAIVSEKREPPVTPAR